MMLWRTLLIFSYSTAILNAVDYNSDSPDDSDSTTTPEPTTLRPIITQRRLLTTTTKVKAAVEKSDDDDGSGSSPDSSVIDAASSKMSKKAVFGLTSDREDMVSTDANLSSKDGSVTLTRCQHTIDGIPVWNSGGVLVETVVPDKSNNNLVRALSVVSNRVNKKAAPLFSQRLAGILQRGLPVDQASRMACQKVANASLKTPIRLSSVRFKSKRFIYQKPTSAGSSNPNDLLLIDDVVVSGRLTNGTMFAYHCLCNAYSHEVLEYWDHLPTATIFGGNEKVGRWQYGENGKADLPYTTSSNGSCQYQSTDRRINVYHAHSQLEWKDPPSNQFDCNIGRGDSTNGGFGVLADLFANAVNATKMFLDPAWGNLTRLGQTDALDIYGHYGQYYQNAYFSDVDQAIFVGDGGYTFYPFGTCLDVIAHEMGHAITSNSSNLAYKGESGCINEAFSDAMGQMAKAYASSDPPDFLIGKDCMKNKPYLRNMAEPKRYSDFFPICKDGSFDCQEVHKCSSIMNYIFYKLATTSGWSVQSAGRAFIAANRVAWTTNTTLRQAGCDVGSIVRSINGDGTAVVNAWAAVGLDISDCVPQTPNGGNSTSPIRIDSCSKQTQLAATKPNQLLFVVKIPSNATSGWIQTYGENGDADLYVEYSQIPTTTSYSHRGYAATSQELLVFAVKNPGSDVYIMINAFKSFRDLWLYACFF